MPRTVRHQNKSYDFAEGGMIPKSLHKLWGMIPSIADIAVTGKLSATPEEYDKARERKEREIEARKLKKEN